MIRDDIQRDIINDINGILNELNHLLTSYQVFSKFDQLVAELVLTLNDGQMLGGQSFELNELHQIRTRINQIGLEVSRLLSRLNR